MSWQVSIVLGGIYILSGNIIVPNDRHIRRSVERIVYVDGCH